MEERDKDLTDEWLRENDPYYNSSSSGKRGDLAYNYETKKQQRYRRKKELPFASLFKNKLYELEEKDVEVRGYIKER